MRKTLALFLLAVIALAAAPVPRAEYPRPQFQREQWLNLNGQWEFEFDDANVGLDENWASGAKKFSRSIVVPFSFESALSGIGDTSFHPWVWYRRSFTVPAAWKGKRVMLHFGAVNYRAMVWINGRLAGHHEGGSVPFSFDITPLLQAGTNTLTVRSEFPPTDRTIPRGKQYWEPKSHSIFYTRTSGIWQTVWLEPVTPTHLERVRITAGADGVARFEAAIEQPGPDLELHATLRYEKQVVAAASAPARGGRALVVAGVAEPSLWSPNSPNLYDVTFELRRGAQVIDRVESYLGFRTVSVEGGRILLNRRPIYLKMVLDQGYWPQSNLTPPSDEAIQYDIKMTKEMGFNGARKHQKLEDPRFLYWADRLGLLVSSEMANAYEYSEAYIERFTKEWMAALQRDYNHPSIIMWVPINESWGTPDLYDSRQQFHLKALYTLTKSFDSTRPVIDNDGWEHTDMTDIFAVHDYARTGEMLFKKYKDAGKPGAPIPDGGRPALAPGFAYNGTPLVLSEFGGIAFIPAGHKVPEEAWGYSGVEKTQEAALQRLRGLYEAIAKLPFAGLCYTQLTDVEQEINGLMTYDRKLKFDPKVLREINRLVR
ncbi:MAG: glycoside hydrolase family 2 protein [Rhodospirillales bacterium]